VLRAKIVAMCEVCPWIQKPLFNFAVIQLLLWLH